MSDFKETFEKKRQELMEKTFEFWIRTALRVMAWIVLLFYMIWRIIIPVIKHEPLMLDSTDGIVISSCIALLLAIEAVKAYFKNKFKKQ